MPRLSRLAAIFTIALFSSACCSIFGEETTGLAGPYAALAFDGDGGDLGLGGDLACDCERFAGLRTGAGIDLFFPDQGNYQMARVFGEWLPETAGSIRPYFSAGFTLKRFSYGGGFESPGFDNSSTNLGINVGIGAQYGGLDRAVPFAAVERLQIDGGGFQVLRFGSRIRLR